MVGALAPYLNNSIEGKSFIAVNLKLLSEIKVSKFHQKELEGRNIYS